MISSGTGQRRITDSPGEHRQSRTPITETPMNRIVRISILLGISTLAAAVLALFHNPVAASPEALSQDAELAAIEATLNDYLYGNRDGDVERLRRAFHPTAEIEGIRPSGLLTWTAEQYVGGQTPGQRREFVPRILAVDFAGTAASAKLE